VSAVRGLPGTDERLLLFEIGASLFALPIHGVLEVADLPGRACIPTVPPEIAQVVNFRGDALPLVGGERLLPLEHGANPEGTSMLVLSDRVAPVPRLGLPVDRVLGLVEGAGGKAAGGDPVAERRPWRGRLMHVVDPARLVARAQEIIQDSLGASG
jgi:chemotaxis signal transduction protein